VTAAELLLVIPAYNGARYLTDTVDRVSSFFRRARIQVQDSAAASRDIPTIRSNRVSGRYRTRVAVCLRHPITTGTDPDEA